MIRLIVFSAIILGLAAPAWAQVIELSPSQQAILNQLPPAQRQQALDAMRELQSSSSSDSQQTINEPVTEAPDSVAGIDSVIESHVERAQARSRIVFDFEVTAGISESERASDPLIGVLEGRHLFVLDDNGLLSLPGLDAIPLLGLSEEEIERRLGADPYLSVFAISASILGQEPIGIEALKPFGYDVFDPRDEELLAPGSGPVPADYVLGPGDTVRVQLFGNVSSVVEREVGRDGVLNLPEIGPVNVAGLSFSAFREDIDRRVSQTLIGTQVSVTMGQLRTIRVFVLGDVNYPGSYVIGGLATISTALYRSGGVSEVGSLRSIQLKRNGALITTFDAYDLLARGDTSNDRRLQQGDVIFVPPVGKTVSVDGAVNRPAIYEVRRLTTAADLIKLAGGLTPDAFAAGGRIDRISENQGRTVLAVDLGSDRANELILARGDSLTVPRVLPGVDNVVNLLGHVHRPGSYAWRQGFRLTDIIRTSDQLKSGVDAGYVLIRRQLNHGEPIEVLSTSIAEALSDPTGDANVLLKSRDIIHVFGLETGRQSVVRPLLEELNAQATFDAPAMAVEISGMVRAPGIYPFEKGMRVSDLVRAGGSLTEAAYVLKAELTRYSVTQGGERTSAVISIDLESIRGGGQNADILLQEHDFLRISRAPQWDSIWTVSLEGEVKFPGRYRVARGELLADVVQRAGGLTDSAFAEGALFLRDTLKEREQEQIDTLTNRLESDILAQSLQAQNSGEATMLDTGQALLQQLREAEATGRLVIDLQQQIQRRGTPVELRDGDRLLVPPRTQVVTVIGEAQQNTSHLYQQDLTRDDYISMSGGLTRRADRQLIYVVRANGEVVSNSRSKWFGRGGRTRIQPGDTIVVPIDTGRIRPLAFWGSVTQILYQGAIAVAAVRTFDN
ncbi:MAG: SLBB domain-containing protein [Woeseiaceae bacterium]|nr:SLBB domain-containing protein [Woeseiaceae bacterium]